jgi:hypothetical protein
VAIAIMAMIIMTNTTMMRRNMLMSVMIATNTIMPFRVLALFGETMSREERGLTREQLYESVWAEPIYRLAPRCGITDVGMAKLCRRYKIPVPGRPSSVRK